MKQSVGRWWWAWYGAGVGLITIGVLLFIIFIILFIVLLVEGEEVTLELFGLLGSVFAVAIGIYGVRRGGKARDRGIAAMPAKERRHRLYRRVARGSEWKALILMVSLFVFFGVCAVALAFNLWWLLLFLIAGIFGLLKLAPWFENRIKRSDEKKGFGIKSLESLGAKLEGPSEDSIFRTSDKAISTSEDRNVTVDVLEVSSDSPLESEGYTRIRVEHKGKILCVVQIRNSARRRIHFFDKDVYMEWRREISKKLQPYEPPLKVPKKVTIHGHKTSTALPEETVPTAEQWVQNMFDDPDATVIRGTIRIEPEQVIWWTQGNMLPQELLEDATDVLVSLANKLESSEK